MTLDEFNAKLHERWTVLKRNCAWAPTGEEYLVLISGVVGIKPEGETGDRICLHHSESDALDDLWWRLEQYAKDKSGPLYLRRPVATEQWEHPTGPDDWTAHIRLLISDKPIHPEMSHLEPA